MSEITDNIVFRPDKEFVDGSVIFETKDTPGNAYDHLLEAVLKAKHHEEYSQVNLKKMNKDFINRSSTRIGKATYKEDEYSGEVTNLEIEDQVLEEYGEKI